MTILYFINGLHPGGKERRLVELLKYIVARKAAVIELAVMSRDMKYPEVLDLGIPIHYLVRKTRKDPTIFSDLLRLCRTVKPDIIHTWDSMTSVYAAPIAKILGTKFVNGMVVEAPGRIRPFSSLWLRIRLSFPFSDVIVGNSRAGLNVFRAPKKKSIHIHNGFDSGRTKALVPPEMIREKFEITTPRIVAMVGEVADRKDFETYVRAASKVLRGRTDVTFLVVGDGPNLQSCRSLVDSDLEEKVKFVGWQTDVESIINAIDIGVLATYTEGISNAILEYMALGKPVIATDGGGTKEIVNDQETGFLVRCKDVDGLAARINTLLDDPERARQMGKSGKARIEEEFSIEAMGEHYLELYNRLV